MLHPQHDDIATGLSYLSLLGPDHLQGIPLMKKVVLNSSCCSFWKGYPLSLTGQRFHGLSRAEWMWRVDGVVE